MISPNHDFLYSRIIGDSPAISRLREVIRMAAPRNMPVLIQGPTGAGKELVAEALHALSGRPGRFIAFNVCAIADSMFEDSLFGHARGAFTGAVQDTVGYISEADRGTLFLDEISGLGTSAQAKLLRVLETKSFRPIGGRTNRRSDFRLIAATNDDLEQLARDGRFRSDLAHRLKGIVVRVPPLIDRMEDLPALAKHFLSLDDATSTRLTSCALAQLHRHHWPGNVRELRNVIGRAVVFADGRSIDRTVIAEALRNGSQPCSPPVHPAEQGLHARLLHALEECGWDTARAASQLGVHRATIYRQMRRFGIPVPRSRLPRSS